MGLSWIEGVTQELECKQIYSRSMVLSVRYATYPVISFQFEQAKLYVKKSHLMWPYAYT